MKPAASWFDPTAMRFSDLVVALLLAVFIYWGWDSGWRSMRSPRTQRRARARRPWSRR